MATSKPVSYTTPAETDDMTRKVLRWFTRYDGLPKDINGGIIKPEPMLEPGVPGMMLTVIQSSIIHRYIVGGHQTEYQFGIIYRIQPGKSMDERLKAIQELNKLGDYAVTTFPDFGDGIVFNKCEVTSQAALFATYDNNDEDYQLLAKLTYEVI